MHAWQFSKALYLQRINGWTGFVTMQDHYNLLNREIEREMLPVAQDWGVGLLPWSPLARGRLTRDWGATSARSETDAFGSRLYAGTEEADHRVVDAVAAVAANRGRPRAQIALAWLLQQPAVTSPIVGATKTHHLDDAVAALDIELTTEELGRLAAPYVPHPQPTF